MKKILKLCIKNVVLTVLVIFLSLVAFAFAAVAVIGDTINKALEPITDGFADAADILLKKMRDESNK